MVARLLQLISLSVLASINIEKYIAHKEKKKKKNPILVINMSTYTFSSNIQEEVHNVINYIFKIMYIISLQRGKTL